MDVLFTMFSFLYPVRLLNLYFVFVFFIQVNRGYIHQARSWLAVSDCEGVVQSTQEATIKWTSIKSADSSKTVTHTDRLHMWTFDNVCQ